MLRTRLLVRSLRAIAIATILAFVPAVAAAQSKPAPTATAKVDINSASQTELESLPGVGAATAKRIIAGRPYAAVTDLSKAGVPASTITKITPLVTVGPATGAPAKSAPPPTAAPTTKSSATTEKAASGAKVDLNTASEKDLEALPHVGPATAKKIIAGRPYAAVGDLAKAGVPAATIQALTPLVTVGAPAKATTTASPPKSAAPASTGAAPPKTTSPTTTTGTPKVPPVKGMVWVNLSTKVYHMEGDKYYGNTKNGKFMTEEDAIKAGYQKAKK